MRKQIQSLIAGSVVLSFTVFNSCVKDETFAKANVETSQVTSITEATATCIGFMTDDGGSEVTTCGVCWSTSPTPTIENDTTIAVIKNFVFSSKIKGLQPNTTYYVRAYAVNTGGVAYGLILSFKTNTYSLTTNPVSVAFLTDTSAICGASILSNGESSSLTVETRGVCWNTSPMPTVENNTSTDKVGGGIYNCSITGLTANTLYYVRAYAINSLGLTYGNEVSFTTQSTTTDIDGNKYRIAKIGTQVWMVENLKTTKFNDGTSIPLVSDNNAWSALSTPGFCYYNNDDASRATYGALYNWYTINTGKLAPTGWHVPTDAEWTTLENYLIANGYNYDGTTIENKIAKSLSATTGWFTSIITGVTGNDLSKNNTSGFTGLPGGYIANNGTFYYIGYYGSWWSSSQYSTNNAWNRYLTNSNYTVRKSNFNMQSGFSVRCVRDN